MTRVFLTALVVLSALPASAQQLSLQIRDGLVTMTASAVPVRQILAEWGRVGGTRVVGAERIPAQPLTLTLENVPEAKALDIILRGAAGYVAAARAVPGSGPSSYDRILVLATSTAPAASTAAAGRPAGRFTTPPAQESPVVETPDVNDVPESAMPDPAQNPFAAAFAQPGMTQPFGQPGQAMPFGQPGAPTPFGVPMAQPNGTGLFVPIQQPPPAQAAPQGFFGVLGSATPGMVQQPVQPGQQPRPRPQN
jgi:hypothetical protein